MSAGEQVVHNGFIRREWRTVARLLLASIATGAFVSIVLALAGGVAGLAIAYAGAHPNGFNPKLYNAMWGPSEFACTGSLKDYDGEPLLARLDGRRTIFLGGQYDEARPNTLAGFTARVPGAEYGTIPGSAHGIFADRTLETVALIRGWLARQDARA